MAFLNRRESLHLADFQGPGQRGGRANPACKSTSAIHRVPGNAGTNENTNLLARQYFPPGTDLSSISQAQLDQVELRLNQRSRKTLGLQTPASKLQASVAPTV
jgi:IS30 family transposase